MMRKDNGSQWRIVSKTHHEVSTNGKQWRKIPFIGTPEHLQVEHSVNMSLGRASQFVGNFLVTEHLGSPLEVAFETVTLDDIGRIVTKLRQYHKTSGLPKLKSLEEWPRRNRQTVLRRIGEEHPVSEFALGIIETLAPSTSAPVGLCHTDPHLGNWVFNDTDLVLLDWESSICAPHDVDLGSLAWSMFRSGRLDAVNLLESVADDPEFFWWAARQKAALNLSYAALYFGDDVAQARADLVAKMMDYRPYL